MQCKKCNDTGVVLVGGEVNKCSCKDFKARFEDYLLEVDREGIHTLLNWLEATGFYEAPASTKYHLAQEGGLVEHSVNVCEIALKTHKALNSQIPRSSVILVSLLHDIGKHQYYNKDYYEDNVLKSGNISNAQPYKRNKSVLPLPHEVSAIHILSKFIDLTEDETWAIIHHNGMYSDLKYNLRGKETELQIILHFADMYASRVKEE